MREKGKAGGRDVTGQKWCRYPPGIGGKAWEWGVLEGNAGKAARAILLPPTGSLKPSPVNQPLIYMNTKSTCSFFK